MLPDFARILTPANVLLGSALIATVAACSDGGADLEVCATAFGVNAVITSNEALGAGTGVTIEQDR